MKVYPVPGRLLRDPEKRDFVPEKGRNVTDSPFWRRRLRDGDASLTPPVVATVEVASTTETAPAAAEDASTTQADPTTPAAAEATVAGADETEGAA